MGKRGAPRTVVSIRLSPQGIAALDQAAADAGLTYSGKPNRSEAARRLLAAALADPAVRRRIRA